MIKKKIKKITVAFLSLLLMFDFSLVRLVAVAAVNEEFVLHKGQSVFISGEHLQKKVELISENDAVASVSGGLITAMSVGETFCKEVRVAEDGGVVEKKYKIKVLSPNLVHFVFTEPNAPKVGETLTLCALTDASVEKVKFLISNKAGQVEKLSEERVADGKNFVHKVRVKFDEIGDFKVFLQVKIGEKWNQVDKFVFDGKILEESAIKAIERRPSEKCLDYIKAKEGFKSGIRADSCAGNTYDIGYGNVVKPGVPFYNNITKQMAHAMLANRLNSRLFAGEINKFSIKNNLNLSQNQFDALLSFTYNVGMSWLGNSDLPKVILKDKNTKSKNKKILVRLIGTVISDNGLRLRLQPNCNCKILEILKFNEQVEILNSDDDGWFRVKAKSGHEGYCFAEFLSVKNEYTESYIAVVNSESGLNVREQPDRNSRQVSRLNHNERVAIISKEYNGWYKVKLKDGTEGFCCADFLTIKADNVEKFMDRNEFSTEFLAFHKAGGKPIKGLLNRRVEELQMFFYGDYSRDGWKNKYDFDLPDLS